MKLERTALHTLITGDTLASPIGAASTTEWVVLGGVPATELAKWALDDPVTFSGTHVGLVRQVVELDAVGNRVKVAPALSSPPLITENILGGMTSWLRTSLDHSGVFWVGPKDSPPDQLIQAEGTDPTVLVWFTLDSQEGIMWASTKGWPLHVLGIVVKTLEHFQWTISSQMTYY